MSMPISAMLPMGLLLVFTSLSMSSAPIHVQPHRGSTYTAAAAHHGLVSIQKYDPTIQQDLRYSTADNAFKRALYPADFPALASDDTARRLARASSLLHSRGYRLCVLDAYRPPAVQQALWDAIRDPRYVADPTVRWSQHCSGNAVDVTLIDPAGTPLRMPSAFDDFSQKAAATYRGRSPSIRHHLTLLQQAMTTAGFSIYSGEWWHFNNLHPQKK